jgi:Dipeptidyl aminopeptidases/acylaminoacyl-peptidases
MLEVIARNTKPAIAVAVVAVAAAGAALIGTAFASAAIARRVVTPDRRKRQDLRILAVADDCSTITLATSADAAVPGRYGLYFSDESGYVRLGDVLSEDGRTVTRAVESVAYGDLPAATRARLSGWYYLRPEELGLPVETVDVPTECGSAPAWLFRAPVDTGRWVIQVHGRGVRRQECLRAVPVFRDAGCSGLVVSYRNDGDAPPSPDGRYGLGSTEWRDVEAAIEYAVEQGATSIVLMGWSMGGAIVLQTAARSRHAETIDGIVLDSPVVDWIPTLEYQAGAMHLPDVVTRGAMRIIDASWAGAVTGQSAPVGLADLDFVARADELSRPMLLMHSDDDGYVPADASRALAERRPDIVTFVPFTVARHTKLWNYDEQRWTTAIAEWLDELTPLRA